MPVAITIFKCEYCGKRRLANKSKVVAHEKICWHNPVNKSCPTCSHSFKEVGETYCDKQFKTRKFGIQPIVNCIDWEEDSQ